MIFVARRWLSSHQKVLQGILNTYNQKTSPIVFNLMNESKFDSVVNHLSTVFAVTEPLSRIVGLTETEARHLFSSFASFAIQQGHSFVVEDESKSNELVGLRISSVISLKFRFQEKSIKAGDHPEEELSHDEHASTNERVIMEFLSTTERKVWEVAPKGEKLFKGEIVSVRPDYQRRGIANNMLHIAQDYARALNCKYITITPTSYMNQSLLIKKHGYKTLQTVPIREYVSPITGGKPFANAPDDNQYVYVIFSKL